MEDPLNSLKNSEKILRLKYYKELRTQGKTSETFLKPPEEYFINPNLFMVIQPSGNK